MALEHSHYTNELEHCNKSYKMVWFFHGPGRYKESYFWLKLINVCIIM